MIRAVIDTNVLVSAGKVAFLVTGNKRHFPQSQMADTKVVSAAELLEFITLEI